MEREREGAREEWRGRERGRESSGEGERGGERGVEREREGAREEAREECVRRAVAAVFGIVGAAGCAVEEEVGAPLAPAPARRLVLGERLKESSPRARE